MEIDSSHDSGRLILLHCRKSTPMARISKWGTQLRNSTIHAVNNIPVATIHDISTIISKSRADNQKEITITFLTPLPIPIHPQQGLPQLFFDQLHAIVAGLHGEREDTLATHMMADEIGTICRIIKDKAPKLTRRILQQEDDWIDWLQSEALQLMQRYFILLVDFTRIFNREGKTQGPST